jgi:hypothetical protein
MSRAVTFILGIVLGVVVGGALVLYFISPRGGASPAGVAIQPPDAQNPTAGTAVIQLKQEFFTPVFQSILREGSSPSFPLSLTGAPSDQPVNEIACGKITLKPEGSGTTTAVKMENGQILVPIAFTGNVNAFGNCFDFNGWAQANLELRYDEAQQIVFGQINVQTVNLDGVAPVVSGLITPVVQSTLNSRVNPVQILRGDQIALKVPIKSTNSTLQAQVRDVRAEIKDNALSLYVTYNFTGEQAVSPAQ